MTFVFVEDWDTCVRDIYTAVQEMVHIAVCVMRICENRQIGRLIAIWLQTFSRTEDICTHYINGIFITNLT